MITIEDAPSHHRYEISVDGELAGFVTYKRAPGEITFVHTEVEERFEHHGLAGKLAAAVLDDARAAGLRVHPVCPYIAKYIVEHPEYADLVAH